MLLVHGWPDSFLRFDDLVPLLADDFDLVIPSIPGYGLSDRPTAPGMDSGRIAELFAVLMTELGHERFAYHGGDLGSGIGEQLPAAGSPARPRHALTNLTPYWVTETAGSAARLYQEGLAATGDDGPGGPVVVPTAVAIFPADIVPAPRVFAERWFDIHRWTDMPRGGHFAAWEEPDLLAADIWAFLAPA